MLEWLESHLLPCWFKAVFGFECPGCGFQRAFLLLLRGEWRVSVMTYPALLPLLLFLLLCLLKIAGLEKIKNEYLKIAGFVCLAIILISYLLKLTIYSYPAAC